MTIDALATRVAIGFLIVLITLMCQGIAFMGIRMLTQLVQGKFL